MTDRILVTDGDGHLGRTVLSLLGERGVAGVRRPETMPGAVLVDADGEVNPPSLVGIAAIINCAGCVTGTAAQIEQANVIYPATLLRRARAAGIPRFVQVSSFSVFGRAERIDKSTPIAPESDYGRSKAEAERVLLALDDGAGRVAALRLPFLFSEAEPAMLGSLVGVMVKARVWPVLPGEPVHRSVITYGSAAEALIALSLAAETPAVQMAADPAPLELATVAAAVRERLGKRVVMLPLPRIAAILAQRIAPRVVDRLFRSSVLAAEANMLTDGGGRPVHAEILAYLDRRAA